MGPLDGIFKKQTLVLCMNKHFLAPNVHSKIEKWTRFDNRKNGIQQKISSFKKNLKFIFHQWKKSLPQFFLKYVRSWAKPCLFKLKVSSDIVLLTLGRVGRGAWTLVKISKKYMSKNIGYNILVIG
jgi:hypothetical protein